MNGVAAFVDLYERLELRVTDVQVAVVTNRDPEWLTQLGTLCSMSGIAGERTVYPQNMKIKWIGVGYYEAATRQRGDTDRLRETLFTVGCLWGPPGECTIRV